MRLGSQRRAPAGAGRRRRRRGAIGSAALFLLAAGAVLVLVGAQTWGAIRSQHRLALKALTDHAATAAWYYEQNLRTELGHAVECVFHPLHRVMPDAVHPTTPSVHLVTGDEQPGLERLQVGPESECRSRPYMRPAAAVRVGPGEETEIAGSLTPGFPLDALREAVRSDVRQRPYVRRSEAVFEARLDGESRLVMYSVQRTRAGDAVYAVVLDSASAASLFDQAARDCQLLPPPILPAGEGNRVLRVTVGPEDRPFYRSSNAAVTATQFVRPLNAALGGLQLRVDITAEGAEILKLTTLPATSVPALAAMLAVSLGLVSLAYRQLRREQDLSRMRAEFVSSVSHELRTPLALQRVFLDMIRLGRAQDEQRFRWAMDNVERESRRLQHLVDTILHFARGEQGQLRVELKRTELGTAVERISAVYRPLLDPSGSQIVVERASEVWVDLDEAAFELALANLFQNAMKYGPERQRVVVRVRAEAPFALVEVDDEGPGIPQAEREKLFLPFRRGEAVRSGETGGSGIGLSVVRQVMRLHDGRALLADAPGGGLRVQLALPLREGMAAVAAPAAPAAAALPA